MCAEWINKMPEVLIAIPAKNRIAELVRCLASVHAQTYFNYSVMLIDDSDQVKPFEDPEVKFWLEALSRNHKVVLQEGHRINQCYGHNMALYSYDCPELVLRLDDDLVLNPDFLANLVDTFLTKKEEGENVGAIGGVYFDNRNPRDDKEPIPTQHAYLTEVLRDGMSYAVAQMVPYSDDELISTEHLYSACLYSRDAMRQVGGWPLVYSDGVAHREETDGTHRMFLAGYVMYIDPKAKAKHEHAPGGIRSLTRSQLEERRNADESLWQKRIYRLRGANYKPSVAVCSYHTEGMGGAQRLFYSLVKVLRDSGNFKFVDVFALGDNNLMAPDEMKSFLGYTLDFNSHMPDHYDVVISLGHEPPEKGELPPRRHHIHYNLYPTMKMGKPIGVNRYVSISHFSATALKFAYRHNAEVIYPFVEVPELDEMPGKDNGIVAIGDVRRAKLLSPLVSMFLEMDLPDSSVLHVVVPELDDGAESAYLQTASRSPRVELHIGISDEELNELYRKCKLLWAARGYGSTGRSPALYCEHFGYTPVEAVLNYCLPLSFDAGGYKETTAVRWETPAELEAATKELLTNREEWQKALVANLELTNRFTKNVFTQDWLRVILSTNSFAWESKYCEWRKPSAAETSDEFHIACISDSPYKGTGYGVIAKQVYKGFLDAGYKVHVLAVNEHRSDVDGLYERWTTIPKEINETHFVTKDFVEARKYDAYFVSRDPFTASRFIRGIRSVDRTTPIIAFISQEGSPPHEDWRDIIDLSDRVLTYSKAAADDVSSGFGHTVEWTHLGVDHANWERYSDSDRQALRRMVGWQDKYVLLNIARNTRNKRHPLMLKTVKILVDKYEMHDILLVMHTKQIGDARFGGHKLPMWVNSLDLEPYIAFTPNLEMQMDTNLDEVLEQPVPRSHREQVSWLSELGMTGLYNLADLYIDPSAAEGFGLPNIEAMACGLPVISVDDGLVRTECLHGQARLIKPGFVDEWNNGADLQLISAESLAESIAAIRQSDTLPDTEGFTRENFKWDNVRAKMVSAVQSCRR